MTSNNCIVSLDSDDAQIDASCYDSDKEVYMLSATIVLTVFT